MVVVNVVLGLNEDVFLVELIFANVGAITELVFEIEAILLAYS